MNILLIGGPGSLTNSIINRLNKEGHKIFLLTGEKNGRSRYGKVTERYDFDYENVNMPEIFDSVSPDVTLFLGAFDSNFKWNDNNDSIRYSSGLMNLLIAASYQKKNRFIYLSSSDIYERNFSEDIKETVPANNSSVKGMALAQAEKMCESYRLNREMDIITLRLDELYSIPKNRNEVNNICSKLCLDSLTNNVLNYSAGNTFSMLFENDAVEFIYRMMTVKNHESSIYNISSSIPVTEEDIVNYIKAANYSDVILNEAGNINSRRVLTNVLYQNEFGMRFFEDSRGMVDETLEYMWNHYDDFVQKENKKTSLLNSIYERIGWLANVLIPYVENLICFIPFFMLNNRAVGSQYFDRLDFYLLYVLLFAIVYGQQQATFSAILATAGYIFRQMYTKTGFEVLTSYSTYIWMIQLFIVGLAVGYMRDKLNIQQTESDEEQNYLKGRITDITDINNSNVRVKNSLETEIINQNNSVGKIYEITSSLNRYMPEEVLFYAVEIISKLMNSKDVAIYMVSGEEYARLFSSTSDKARSLGNSIRYKETKEMYEALEKDEVFINRRLDFELPMMAKALYMDEKIQMIIMVWGIKWEAMTLGQANLLSVVSSLVQDSVLKAARYISALEQQRYNKNGNVLKKEAFDNLLKAYLTAANKGLTQCELVVIPDGEIKGLEKKVSSCLRGTDYIGSRNDNNLYVLLANTNLAGADCVIDRFKNNGIEGYIEEEVKL